ncbi:2-phosphosulfolactate phosphatase family protein [Gloeobacter kilaueensis]|uniref:Probable 2-phosphosulfolactate phosphatase n=1 Tax=Gloeobacter kilaueensis (strain ATCC BAA-2537 / CCAP 1431/1 / ULC 316 / JS1) TaxID=1183438 RepID=U5QG49_GLOK1|nr:2-phosphosulfolactate phosphatase family protein [Gloeobacter kilaueensis]AGY57833.1 2-phosphosulfolactate phosphatase [Gloeobacter kilaueensis JS1]
MQVSVFHTPELVPEGRPACAVAIDVLRATSTIATALANGAAAVHVFADLKTLDAAANHYPQDQVLRGGERDGKQVEGFDFGNSPFFCTRERVADRHIFMSTTNGTRTLQRISHAPVVLTAALINVAYVAEFIRAQAFETVWLVGSGWQGSFSLEDTACAGALVEQLGGAANDEAVAAAALFDSWQDDLVELFEKASHGQRLLKLGLLDDIVYCATANSVRSLPCQREPGVLVQGLTG